MNRWVSDLDRLDEGLRGIRTLPAAVLDELYGLTLGTLEERVAGAITWREALLAGELPAPGAWPGPTLSAPVRKALAQLDLPRFARANPELVAALLADVVRAFVRGELDLTRAISDELRRLEADALRPGRPAARPRTLSAEEHARLHDEAKRTTTRRLAERVDQALMDLWRERVAAWRSIEEVFGALGDTLGLGWDLTRGVLKHRGWTDLAALRKLIERLPELTELVTSLGRLRAKEDGPSVTEAVVQAMVRELVHTKTVTVPGVPPEIRGVERSGELSRMLPMEAAFLGHPTLKHLWHARRHEHALMTYAVEGVDFVHVTTEEAGEETITRPKPPQDKGPMIVCLDTSGSMAGAREMVAKALVLEVMRTALREKREALLFQFSGPGDVAELRLDLSEQGVGRLLDFLGLSFHGGTDVDAPLRRAMERLRQAAWKDADVLLVSDGEFGATSALVADIATAKSTLGARLHGLLVGGHSQQMAALCDHVQRFTRWSQLRDG